MTYKPHDEKQDQRNLMIAMLAIAGILFLSKAFFPADDLNRQPVVTPTETVAPADVAVAVADVSQEPVAVSAVQEPVVVPTTRVPLKSDLLSGSVKNKGAVFDALNLSAYRETIEPESPTVQLLSSDYTAHIFWKSAEAQLPDEESAWTVSGDELTPFSPVLMTFDNADVRMERTLRMDEGYMFFVEDRVVNKTQRPLTLSLNAVIDRKLAEIPPVSTVHQGFLGFLKGKLVEETYDDVADEAFTAHTSGGWMGLTDKYWQSVFAFDEQTAGSVSFEKKAEKRYRAVFSSDAVTVPAGGQVTRSVKFFAGAKEISLINRYEKSLSIPRFDLSVDFGWFYFLTKPFLYFLNWLYAMVGNMGIAILIFATLLRIALLPIATKSYESMAKMRKIQPKIKALQERFKNDKMRLQQEMMLLYKRDKVNPASGCLPMLLQIPVFFALYKVLSVSINMRQAPFFGWIQDLSVPDPASVLTLFGYLDWPVPAIINIGVWPVLMGLTMWIQQKLNPQPMDKSQETIFKIMPIIFTFMLGNFAAGLVIYWTWSNVLSIAQQKYIMKKVGV